MCTQLIPRPPPVSWAQRTDSVFLTFNVEAEEPDIKIERRAVTFEGICKYDKIFYGVVIALYADIDPKKSSYVNKGRYIEVNLTKDKADAPFWPYLTQDRKKHHWLKIDFNRWQDEEESDDLDEVNNIGLDKLGVEDYGDHAREKAEDCSSDDAEELPESDKLGVEDYGDDTEEKAEDCSSNNAEELPESSEVK